ncbi:MAG: hypothetical protein M3342_18610 [Bacteroidota bacterium]|nr:hypothetical protein [Bacteroidota bacterium]
MERNIQQKLLYYEAQPPESAWQKIEAALESSTALKDKLNNYEEPPQPYIWDKIAAVLNESENQKPAVALRQGNKRAILKYTAAASLLFIVALSVLFLLNKKRSDEGVSYAIHNENSKAGVLSNNTNVNINIPAAPEKEKHSEPGREPLDDSLPEDNSTLALKANQEERASEKQLIANNYLIYETGSGNVVRMPKKLYPIFSCTYDEDIVQAYKCRQKIRSLQEQVALKAPPSTDFAAMLYLIKDLQNNHQ